MAYFTLITREDPSQNWAIEFGDYDRETVNEELNEMRYSAKIRGDKIELKIVRTATAHQSAINAAVAALNPSGEEGY